jgi:hypothetical protein
LLPVLSGLSLASTKKAADRDRAVRSEECHPFQRVGRAAYLNRAISHLSLLS